MLNRPPSYSHCSASSASRGSSSRMYISRCVDCSRPLFGKSWKEKLKGQLKMKFLWPSKNRLDSPGGRYIVKQRCGDCQEPLRCTECSEAFFANLSSDEIRVFIKAMVLFAMKGLCMDCREAFRFVYHELFDEASCATSAAPEREPGENQSDIVIDSVVTNPKAPSEIQTVVGFSEGKKMQRVEADVMASIVRGDWKKEMNDVRCNRFHHVLER